MSPATACSMSWVWSACTRTRRLTRRPCGCCELATASPTFKVPEYSRTKLSAPCCWWVILNNRPASGPSGSGGSTTSPSSLSATTAGRSSGDGR
ncbi:hypothetical protein G6F59_018901 [Rhizopus arrhizus]|nr:hypothetical protein G6F59_018901 [Rhizopus arrhizus]